MKLLRDFTSDELELISRLLSQHGGDLMDSDDRFKGSKRWEELWNLQSYFNDQSYL